MGDQVYTSKIIEKLMNAKAWIFDVDGTLVRTARVGGEGGTAIEGAANLITSLRVKGCSVILCTQASGKTPKEYAEGLAAAGLPIQEEDLITAGFASALILKQRYPSGRILVLGTNGITDALRNEQLQVVDPQDPGEIDAVMIGSASSYDSHCINIACKAIIDGADFYTTTNSFWFDGGDGRSVAPTAVIAAAIGLVVERDATVIGKPSTLLGNLLLTKLGVKGGDVVVVDDNLPHGILLAHNMGATSIMPLTGASTREEAESLPGTEAPTLICESVNEINRLLHDEYRK
jgi:HAD superfamily hydrolase (TIGR01450 family)